MELTAKPLQPLAARWPTPRFFGRSPEKLDPEDVRAFQVHLVAGPIRHRERLGPNTRLVRCLAGGRVPSIPPRRKVIYCRAWLVVT